LHHSRDLLFALLGELVFSGLALLGQLLLFFLMLGVDLGLLGFLLGVGLRNLGGHFLIARGLLRLVLATLAIDFTLLGRGLFRNLARSSVLLRVVYPFALGPLAIFLRLSSHGFRRELSVFLRSLLIVCLPTRFQRLGPRERLAIRLQAVVDG